MSEFDKWPQAVQEERLAHAGLLARFGLSLGWPHANTLIGSAHTNMKKLRQRDHKLLDRLKQLSQERGFLSDILIDKTEGHGFLQRLTALRW